ncbi:MAG TPA: chemotaxis protein CheB [Rhodanobacter sp.]|nr:chemotaxis protein CheB [Rhodanobacter sp.]
MSDDRIATVVVGIGASAGGVEALSAFLDHELNTSGAAFLIAMHLSPVHSSNLPEILSRHTSMPVLHAEHDMPIERNKVYILPPGMVMTVGRQRLQLSRANPDERVPTAIDRLFDSLARVFADRAIGVVLSGTGSDGALGLKAIKDRGGLTIAQVEDGTAPQFPGMPQSAIAIGAIDLQLSVENIGPRLLTAVKSMESGTAAAESDGDDPNEPLLKEICTLLLERLGHDFSGYKRGTFLRRVQRRMRVLRLSSMQAYVDCLRRTPEEITLLFRDLLISVTSFFREAESFEFLEQHVIPALFNGKQANDEVRVWVPGCATGEEAYSLAMLLLEYASHLGRSAPNLRVFATDLDEHALAIARRGSYPSVLLDAMTAARRRQFFVDNHGHFGVQTRLREICTFSLHNVLRDPPFSHLDLVSCRNLMIYLGPEFQQRILPILHFALVPEGFLFLGSSESVSQNEALFHSINKTHSVFQRTPHTDEQVTLPLLSSKSHPAPRRLPLTETASPARNGLQRQIEARVLHDYAPPHVLVNAQGEALFHSSRTGAYLEFAVGAPNRQLLHNARKELRLPLRRGLHDAAALHARVVLPEVILTRGDALRRIQISIEPFEHGEAPLYLVLFHDCGAAAPRLEHPDAANDRAIELLERELQESRDQLQTSYEESETAVGDLRASNEELMSANEELQSSNEELETSKEELQSVNEELNTVNAEMARQKDALAESNADLANLLESIDIAAIFLDRHMAIRRFTRSATDIFTLIPSDTGRLITDLAHQLDDVDLRSNFDRALNQKQPTELRVSRRDDSRHYLMKMLPYTGVTEESGGVVMTFADVSSLVEIDLQATLIGELNHRVRNMLAVISAMAQQTLASAVAPETLDVFMDRLHAMARTYKLLTENDWSHMDLRALVNEELTVIAGSTRFGVRGPSLKLTPREALALCLVLHELAANALKYGALSNHDGRVDISWTCGKPPDNSLDLRWQESAGPPVTTPTRRGFGTLLLERQLVYELNAQSDIDYAAGGLVVSIHIPRPPPGAMETS